MSKMFWTALALLAPFVLSATAQSGADTVYGSASYLLTKPGKTEARRARLEKYINVGMAEVMKANPDFLGSLVLELAYPSPKEMGHDSIIVGFSKKPPTFGGRISQVLLKAMGESEEEYRATLEANRTLEKSEVWTSVYRHGSFPKGGLVRIGFVDPPKGMAAEYLEMTRELESGVRAEIVKTGTRAGMQLFQLWGTAEEAPYNFVQIEAATNAEELHKSLGSRIDLFRAAHPGKVYGRYLERYNEASNMSKWAVYRITQVLMR